MNALQIQTFDYEDIIPAVREAYVTRNLEVNITPELTELSAEFDVPVPTIKRFFLSEDWEGQRATALKDFSDSFSKLRRAEIDQRALLLMNEIGRMTKQNVEFLSRMKPILFQKIEAILDNPDPKAIKPETIIKLLETLIKLETGVVDLAIKIKKELDDPDGTGDHGRTQRTGSLLDTIRVYTKVLREGKEDTPEEKALFDKLDQL